MAWWKEDADGVALYPEHHRLLHDAGSCRAVDVVIGAGVREPPHTHAWPSFMFLDSPTLIEVRLVGEAGEERTVFASEGAAREAPAEVAAVQAMDAEPFHYVANMQRDRSYRATRIELRPGGAGGDERLPPPPGVPIQLDLMPVGDALLSVERVAYHALPGLVRATVWAVRVAAGGSVQATTNRASACFVLESSVPQAARGAALVRGVDEAALPREPLRLPAADPSPPPEGEPRPRVWHLGPRECVDLCNAGEAGPELLYVVEVV